MIKEIIIKLAIIFAFFIIGGLATTNILRLLKGNTLSVLSSQCVCANCKIKISAINQTPIISYIVNKGRCRNCKKKLPINALILEIIVFLGMTIISALFLFRPLGIVVSFVYYELIKIVYIVRYGKRETSFLKQYILSFLIMFVYFILLEFMSMLLYA